MNPTTLSRPITISQVAVPLQVCYIIPLEAPAIMLSEIFAECHQRWGGRDTLLIPVVADGSIDEQYLSWGQSLEPDVVYSYVPLDVPMLEHIDRILMPAEIIVHREMPGIGHPMRPRHNPSMRGLPALSALPAASNIDRVGMLGRFALISSFMGWPEDPFVMDTFGLSPYGPGWAQTTIIRRYADMIALGAHTGPPNRDSDIPQIANSTELLRTISDGTHPTALSMAQLCGMGYEHVLQQRSSSWANFNIVVGDTALDRIAFWNSRVGCDDYQRKNIVSVRVDEAKLGDDDFIEVLAQFVSRWNTSTSQTGPSFATVCSSSVEDDRLRPIVEALAPRNVHARIEQFDNVNACLPQETNRKTIVRGGIDQRYTESVVPLAKTEPLNLTKAGPLPSWFLTGGWTVQVTVKRENGRTLGSSVPRVGVPRRWQAVRSIAGGNIAKATVDGDLRLFIRPDQKSGSLTFTDDDAEFVASMFRPFHHLTTTDPRNAILQPDRIQAQTSSAGRHLRGLLNKLGDIREAAGILEDEFWKAVFLDMAVPREVFDDAKRSELAARLKKPIQRNGPRALANDEDFESLAETVAQIAPELKTPTAKRDFDWFVEMYRETEVGKRARDPVLDAAAVEKEIRSEVEEQLRRRCAEGVFVQGYDWRCPRCLHRNWSTVGDLGPILTCEVCRHHEPILAHFSWDFLLDGYVALGLRERGLRGLVWTLGYLSWSSHDSFMFAPPLDLIQNGVQLTDSDIACIVDNRFVIGEVKESTRSINDGLGDRLIDHARIIRPDVVVLACYDPTSLATVMRQTDRIREALKELGIDVRGMVPKPGENGVPPMLMARGMWTKERLTILAFRSVPTGTPPPPPVETLPAVEPPTDVEPPRVQRTE